MLAHLRMEAYAGYARPIYPGSGSRPSIAGNNAAIERGKQRFETG
jgi:hypothetical protein